MQHIWAIATVVPLINVPFGYWREGKKSQSLEGRVRTRLKGSK